MAESETDDVLEESYLENTNGNRITYAAIREAMQDEAFDCSLVGEEAKWVEQAVNQGIDSHLEACLCPTLGDKAEWKGTVHAVIKGKKYGRVSLDCAYSPESFPTLLRRLYELDVEYNHETSSGPGSLADAMLMVLGFDEYGKFVGREALGLD